MYYVTKGSTIDTHFENREDLFCDLMGELKFSYDTICLEMDERVVKDIVAEDKLSNEEFLDALFTQDYDVQNYLRLILDSFLSVTDVVGANCGEATDIYSVDNEDFAGDQYTFAELAYENNWNVVSFNRVEADKMIETITKNSSNGKKIYYISDKSQFLLYKSLNCDTFLTKYCSSFENVYCVRNCSFDNWDSLSETERFRVVSVFFKEIGYVIHNEFSKLGRFPGRNSNRVEKINNNLFEYRISNPNYRIYYSRNEEKLIILKGLLKRRQDIPTGTMNNLVHLSKQPYEKA